MGLSTTNREGREYHPWFQQIIALDTERLLTLPSARHIVSSW